MPLSALLNTRTEEVQSLPKLVPAAQYVRMSDETQEYSIENQKPQSASMLLTIAFAL
jgi:hypothetical protein